MSSSYEELRTENLQRNEAFLQQIGINQSKRKLESNKNNQEIIDEEKEKRKTRRKFKKAEEEFIPRRSTRHLKIDGKEGEDDGSTKKTEDFIFDKKRKSLQNLLISKEEEAENTDIISTEEFLRGLEESKAEQIRTPRCTNDEYERYLCQLLGDPINKKDIDEEKHYFCRKERNTDNDILKVTNSRNTSLIFHPISSKTVVIGGDHTGHVGIWDASSSDTTMSQYMCRPHTNAVCALNVRMSHPSAIWTASLDKTLRWTDIEKSQFSEAYKSDTVIRDAAFGANSLVYLGCDRGFVHAVDPREKTNTAVWVAEAHDGKNIRSIQCHPLEEHLLMTSIGGKSGCIAVHDVRMIGKKKWPSIVQLDDCHDDLINAAAISPDGKYVVSVSQDDTLNTWFWEDLLLDKKTAPQKREYFANNNDSRKWLSKIRPVFDPKHDHAFVIGSMEAERCFKVFSLSNITGKKDTSRNICRHVQSVFTYSDEKSFLSTLCPRVACHPTQYIIAAANSSGKVYLFR